MRVLVCGGREYSNYALLATTLCYIRDRFDIDLLIHGEARGADTLAGDWATENNIRTKVYPALWDQDGRAAGPLRNQRMLDEGQPDLVVAFPGGKGTADMVRRAQKAGIPVETVND